MIDHVDDPGPGVPWWAPLLLLAALAACGRPSDPPGPAPPPEPLPEISLRIRVTGSGYRWHIRYPGPDGLLDSEDDLLTMRHLHLPTEADITLDLRSDDYTYLFYVPELGIMESALPDMPYDLRFDTDVAGSFDLKGGQMCGLRHPELLGNVVVHEREEFREWLESGGS